MNDNNNGLGWDDSKEDVEKVSETPMPVRLRKKHTVESILAQAKVEGWKSSKEWRKASMSSYVTASNNGWLSQVYEVLGFKGRPRKPKTEA